MGDQALLIGNSDGIGLATTRELLRKGWNVAGISRSDSPVEHPCYVHVLCDVSSDDYPGRLEVFQKKIGPIDLCIYCAGIGELLDPADMRSEYCILDVNLTGMVKTASGVIPGMVERRRGHFIGLSSLADDMLSPEAPSYHASKSGFTCYLESLALALRPKGVRVTNVRFGFVDTKMAKGDDKPLMMGVDKAVSHLIRCIRKKPVRHTAPRLAIPLVKFRKCMLRLSTWFG
jgi:short-subunit dehydrogenase